MPAIGGSTYKLSRARPAPANSPFLLHDYLGLALVPVSGVPELPLELGEVAPALPLVLDPPLVSDPLMPVLPLVLEPVAPSAPLLAALCGFVVCFFVDL